MNDNTLVRFAKRVVCGIACALVLGVGQSAAQTQPATIPTVVAQAMTFEPDLLGRPQFFDGRTPTNWPAALTPPAAKVVGGGVVGDSAMYRMRVAVFEFSPRSNPRAVFEDMVARAGYVRPSLEVHPRGGGFVETAVPTPAGRYCNGSTFLTFAPVDSVHAPLIFAVFLLDGEAGRQNCSREGVQAGPQRFPVTVPPMSAPIGAMALGSGSGWSGSSGQMTATLRTTMPTDSILAHYSAQLVAGGWKREGRPANAEGAGVQRFSFREGQDAWTAALIITAAGERREVLLSVSKNE